MVMSKLQQPSEDERRRAERLMAIWDRMFGHIRHLMGRRNRTLARRKAYNFAPRYVPLTGTGRHCYHHPANPAVAMEVNGHDKSYRVPVCYGCSGQMASTREA